MLEYRRSLFVRGAGMLLPDLSFIALLKSHISERRGYLVCD